MTHFLFTRPGSFLYPLTPVKYALRFEPCFMPARYRQQRLSGAPQTPRSCDKSQDAKLDISSLELGYTYEVTR